MGKIVALLVFLLLPVTAIAQGSLLLIPKRVVFDGRNRSQILNVANAGSDTIRYTITVVELRMGNEGQFEPVPDTIVTENSIGKHLKVFPRTLILGPNESQVVKVQLINTSKLQKGEYRSHLHFQPLKEKKKEESFKIHTTMNFKVIPQFSVSIPVIARIDDYNVNLTAKDLSFSVVGDTLPVLNGTFIRSGLMSVYGNLSVEHISPEGNSVHVATAKGIAIYTPNTIRNFSIKLNNKMGVDFSKGKLQILFTTQVEDRPVKIFEKMLDL